MKAETSAPSHSSAEPVNVGSGPGAGQPARSPEKCPLCKGRCWRWSNAFGMSRAVSCYLCKGTGGRVRSPLDLAPSKVVAFPRLSVEAQVASGA